MGCDIQRYVCAGERRMMIIRSFLGSRTPLSFPSGLVLGLHIMTFLGSLMGGLQAFG